MDAQLRGSLVLAAAAVPYVAEILSQLPLQARAIAALPPATRAALPPHPRRPWLAVFGSTRFFLALFWWALRSLPEDSPELTAFKRRMRWSAVREMLFGGALVAVLCALLRSGWRPAWPFR